MNQISEKGYGLEPQLLPELKKTWGDRLVISRCCVEVLSGRQSMESEGYGNKHRWGVLGKQYASGHAVRITRHLWKTERAKGCSTRNLGGQLAGIQYPGRLLKSEFQSLKG